MVSGRRAARLVTIPDVRVVGAVHLEPFVVVSGVEDGTRLSAL